MTAVGSPLQSQAHEVQPARPVRITFLGAPFDLRPLKEVLSVLRTREAGDPFRYVVTPNVDHINQIAAHPEILAYYRDAWQCWCDSQVVRRLGRLFGHQLPLINGTDGVQAVFAEVVRPGDRIALIAAHPGIPAALRAYFPNLTIDAHCPPMGFDAIPAAVEACIDFALASRARFLFMAVGAPRSERLCHLIAQRPDATGTAFCIGAAIEFVTGEKKRAPAMLQRFGLEWLHRLASEPRRLWRRYLLGVIPLSRVVWREAVSTPAQVRPQQHGNPRPVILHISADYPNPIRKPATRAVEHLVERLDGFDQIVVSLFRIGVPKRTYWRDLGLVDGRRVLAYGYYAPPMGVGMLAFQYRLSRRILAFLAKEGLSPDLVHGHRFTFEGIASWLVARRLGIPLFLSVRGEVERKVMRAKPTYRPLWRRMASDAARILYVSAWFQPEMERLTGIQRQKSRRFPNIVVNTRRTIEPSVTDRRVLTVMDLDVLKRKNLAGLLSGFARAASDLDGIHLDIVGGGAPASRAQASDLVRANNLEPRATLVGRVSHSELLERLKTALFLALPSFDETFGMVFTEALFAGTPILYARDSGIDGYLDGLAVGEAVNPHDPDDIARALRALSHDNESYRRNIHDNAEELFHRFDPESVIAAYADDVTKFCAAPKRV